MKKEQKQYPKPPVIIAIIIGVVFIAVIGMVLHSDSAVALNLNLFGSGFTIETKGVH